MIRIGADVGGTFTDVVALDDRGGIWTHKVPSTPPHFERAVLAALDQLIPLFSAPDRTVSEVAHGTTVATNAVLEHRGARTALITTQGFRDVLGATPRPGSPTLRFILRQTPAPSRAPPAPRSRRAGGGRRRGPGVPRRDRTRAAR